MGNGMNGAGEREPLRRLGVQAGQDIIRFAGLEELDLDGLVAADDAEAE